MITVVLRAQMIYYCKTNAIGKSDSVAELRKEHAENKTITFSWGRFGVINFELR